MGLAAQCPTKVRLPAGESIITILSIRNPTQAELDSLLQPIEQFHSDMGQQLG